MTDTKRPSPILPKKQELETAILKVDTYLQDGFLLFTEMETDFLLLSDKEDGNTLKFYKESNRSFTEWFDQVSNYLLKNLTYHHYYFHFCKPKNLLENMPWDFKDFLKNFESHLFALEEVIILLRDDKNLTVRQEIAKKEYQAEILYKITYNDHSREIKLNGITIVKPDFESENDRFFDYVYRNSNRSIPRKEIEDNIKEKLKKNNSDILKDLGFTGTIRQIFFPGTSKLKIKFNNPITKEYAFEHDLPNINMLELKGIKGKQRESKRG
ncbi:MAG: hypothetical protein ABIP54_05085 [Candidatus Andersenbacteria bacterium]